MIVRTDSLEGIVKEQNAKIDRSIAEINKNMTEMFDTIRLIQANLASSSAANPLGRTSPMDAATNPPPNHGSSGVGTTRRTSGYWEDLD
ncbi:unnamed protein product [Arabis nemorensis]|uniref:Uncharacterized protein n=1 Tax=Arabis nemorensis TaxID=586526 RepID=A0A565CJ87_9BRAS|nr:unnamed protein product [Arabis nemorensis]